MSDPRQRVWDPPVEQAPAPADLEHVDAAHGLVARLHFGAWAVLAVVVVATAGGLGYELWTAEGNLKAEQYTSVLGLHAISGRAVSLGPVCGIVGLMLLPSRLQQSGFRAPWLAWVSLALWMSGAVLMLWTPSTMVLGTPDTFLRTALLVSGFACLAAMILLELALARTRWGNAPLFVAGVGLGATMQLLAFGKSVLMALGPRLGLPTLGSGVDDLPLVTVPVVLGIAADLFERMYAKKLPRAFIIGVILLVSFASWVAPWVDRQIAPGAPAEGALVVVVLLRGLASLLAVVSLGVVPIAVLIGRKRAEPRGLAALLAVALALVGTLLWAFLNALSVDVHLHDTYFVVGTEHFMGTAAVMLALAAAFDRPALAFGRRPRGRWAALGLFLLVAGFGVAFASHLVLGQQGMPRRYWAYVEQFEPTFRWGLWGAAAGALGLVLLVIALVRGARARE